MKRLLACMWMAALTASAWAIDTVPGEPVFSIPQVDGIAVDGNGEDWDGKGFAVEMMMDKLNRVQDRDDLDARFRLAWDAEGLLLLVQVHDDVWFERKNEVSIWDGDSLEIFFVKERGTTEMMQVVVAPGTGGEFPEMRTRLLGARTGPAPEGAAIDAVRTVDGQDYTFEMRFPWSNLGMSPKQGLEMGFQIFVNDVDQDTGRFQAVWYPMTRTHERSERSHRIVLAKKASPAVTATATGEYDTQARTRIHVRALAAHAGEPVSVRLGKGAALAEGVLKALGPDHVSADLAFPMMKQGPGAVALDVYLGKKKIAAVALPDSAVQLAKLRMIAEVNLDRYVFSGENFPSADFESPLLGELLCGAYTVNVTYYDAGGNEVTQAKAPGRYGAIIDITGENGVRLRRYRTLYRTPDEYAGFSWWFYTPSAQMKLPDALHIPESVLTAEAPAISRFLNQRFVESLDHNMDSAVLLAGLAERDPADATVVNRATDVWAVDRQWWVDLKRKLDGSASAYPNQFVCPRPKEGAPAPVLRDGGAAQAGMKPEAVEAIDAACREWIEASGEPFATCIARNGVVFFEKAYGERDGQPMTVTTKSWMASISKLMSGTLMMELVDQGLVDLDAPLDTYLPALRGIDVPKPLTVRHLYTHTNGLLLGITWPGYYPDHWGDELADLDQLVAEYYPYLDVGKAHGYNGVGYALGGKVIEAVSGEAIPQFFMNHLWGPLGCLQTDAVDTSARIFSVPRDIAKVGQMLLNKGAYGDMRFFSEATFEKQLPQPLTALLGADTDLSWGIGAVYMPDPGLSSKTFGHGAASAATLRIDPENNLVIVMTRNRDGKDYWTHHPKFIKAIADNIEK